MVNAPARWTERDQVAPAIWQGAMAAASRRWRPLRHGLRPAHATRAGAMTLSAGHNAERKLPPLFRLLAIVGLTTILWLEIGLLLRSIL